MSGQKKNINPIMGIRIKQLREAMNMEQQELAQKMGRSKSAVSKVESGLVDINFTSLEKYAEILNTSISYLLGKTNNPSRSPQIIAARNITTDNSPVIIHTPNTIPSPKQQLQQDIIHKIQNSNLSEDKLKEINNMIDWTIQK